MRRNSYLIDNNLFVRNSTSSLKVLALSLLMALSAFGAELSMQNSQIDQPNLTSTEDCTKVRNVDPSCLEDLKGVSVNQLESFGK